MTQFINKAREQVLLYWLVIFYMLLFTLVSLAFGVATALYGVNWDQLSGQEKFVIKCLIFGNWGTVMMAFINKAITRASGGQLPIASDDQQLLNPPRKEP